MSYINARIIQRGRGGKPKIKEKKIYISQEKETHKVNEAIRSVLEKLNPALHFVKIPVLVSKETSLPSAMTLLPKTPEKLTTGFAVNPMLVLIPA